MLITVHLARAVLLLDQLGGHRHTVTYLESKPLSQKKFSKTLNRITLPAALIHINKAYL